MNLTDKVNRLELESSLRLEDFQPGAVKLKTLFMQDE